MISQTYSKRIGSNQWKISKNAKHVVKQQHLSRDAMAERHSSITPTLSQVVYTKRRHQSQHQQRYHHLQTHQPNNREVALSVFPNSQGFPDREGFHKKADAMIGTETSLKEVLEEVANTISDDVLRMQALAIVDAGGDGFAGLFESQLSDMDDSFELGYDDGHRDGYDNGYADASKLDTVAEAVEEERDRWLAWLKTAPK